MSDEDTRLMLLVKEGSERAFRQLFQKYAPRIAAYAWRFFRNRALAEEAAQETFLHLWRARGSYQPKAAFSTWLFIIASRICIKEAARRPALAASQQDPPAEAVCDPERQAGSAEQLRRLHEVLEKLPAQQRAALWLVRLEGLSYQEAAKALKMSLPAVKSALFRATQMVRTVLEE